MENPMRTASAMALAIIVSAAGASAWWSKDAKAPSPAPALAPATAKEAPAPTPVVTQEKCDNPNAWGVERIVQIDTTGGPGFGFEHFKAYDFLRDHEVVLTFDDGP
jgi:hypothetical protein